MGNVSPPPKNPSVLASAAAAREAVKKYARKRKRNRGGVSADEMSISADEMSMNEMCYTAMRDNEKGRGVFVKEW